MELLAVVKQRMEELGLGQKDVAAGAEVTESYISQLLTGKKAPPAPERTDIYSKMEASLRLPKGRLATLARLQRKQELKRKIVDPPAPLFKEVRKVVLRKCASDNAASVRSIFEMQPFGEIERMITQKLLDVVKTVAREELDSESWLQLFARISERRYEEVRVDILEFLDTDVFHVSDENCVKFMEPLIESWDIDFATFAITIMPSRRLGPGPPKRFEFVERDLDPPHHPEPGLEAFLADRSLRGDATDEELAFLRSLRFDRRRPTAMYFYRELQSLRDPLHFRNPPRRSPDHSRSNPPAKRLRKRAGVKGPR